MLATELFSGLSDMSGFHPYMEKEMYKDLPWYNEVILTSQHLSFYVHCDMNQPKTMEVARALPTVRLHSMGSSPQVELGALASLPIEPQDSPVEKEMKRVAKTKQPSLPRISRCQPVNQHSPSLTIMNHHYIKRFSINHR